MKFEVVCKNHPTFFISFARQDTVFMESAQWSIEKRKNGALIVRMHSCDAAGNALPDAVFTFRPNDPQYDLWLKRYSENGTKSVPDGKAGRRN